jgi:hypothetical protein
MIIIGLVGKANSGKDTFSNFLVSHYNFKKLSFASSLKDALSVIFGWDRNLLEGETDESRNWRETIDPYWDLTPRRTMQIIGTNIFRNHFDRNIWIKSLLNKINNLPLDSKIVISDCRFINEIQSLKEFGATIIRINRDSSSNFKHESENDIQDIFVDFDIDNNGTIEDFYNYIKTILKSYNLN